jgi:hypothetical protein
MPDIRPRLFLRHWIVSSIIFAASCVGLVFADWPVVPACYSALWGTASFAQWVIHASRANPDNRTLRVLNRVRAMLAHDE